MPDMDFKEELKLDKHALDYCALTQPELFAKWGAAWADAANRRDRLKDRLNVVRSECDAEVREAPHKFGWDDPLKKITEAFINSAVSGHPKMVEANEEYLDAVHEANLMQVAKEAFEQRRKMIETLVQLHNSGYFSGNKDFDKSYQPAVEASAKSALTGDAGTGSRMQRRKLGHAGSN